MIGTDKWVELRPSAGILCFVRVSVPSLNILTIIFSLALLLQCINSIDRALLNEGLLEEASAVPNIRLFFKHKVLAVDFDDRIMSIRDIDSEADIRTTFHLCIGADGSYSIIRRQLMRVVRCAIFLCRI